MSQLKAVTDSSFAEDVIEASRSKPVVVDFWAAWCGPCRMLGPVLEELSEETPEVEFVGVDVDANPELSMAFGVRSIPFVVKVEDGKVTESFLGARAKHDVKKALKV